MFERTLFELMALPFTSLFLNILCSVQCLDDGYEFSLRFPLFEVVDAFMLEIIIN